MLESISGLSLELRLTLFYPQSFMYFFVSPFKVANKQW